MIINWKHLPEEVAAKLRAFHRRRQLLKFLCIQFAAAAIYAILILLATHADRLSFLETSHRLLLTWGVHAAAILLWTVSMAGFVFRVNSSRSVAYAFEDALEQDAEECFVTLDGVLSCKATGARTAVRTLPTGSQAALDFLADLTQKACRHSEGIRPAKLVKDRRLLKLACVLAAVGVLYLMLWLPAGYQFPLMLERFYNPQAPLEKPSFVKIDINYDNIVANGDEVVIEANIDGEIPFLFGWIFSLFGGSPGGCTISSINAEKDDFPFCSGELIEMNRIDRRLFISYRSNLENTFSFRVRSGDAQTLAHVVHVVPQPVVYHTVLAAQPPDYVHQKELIVQNPHLGTSRLAFLPNTRIRLEYKVDKPVAKTEVLVKDTPDESAAWDGETLTGTYEMVLTEDTRLEITATDEHGFSNVVPARIDISVREDQPPSVRLASPPTQIQRVPGEIVAFSAQVEEDYGIEKVFLRFIRNPDERLEYAVPSEIPLEVEQNTAGIDGESSARIRYDVAMLFDIGETGAVPGDVIVAQIRARDTAGNDGFSPEVRIEIVPFTRDENERRRLAALAVVHEALKYIGEVYADEELQMPAETPAPIKTLADIEKVSSFQGMSPEAISRMLELEHHFTDRHRHKEDVRRLRSVINYVFEPFDADDDSDEYRAGIFSELSDEILPGLTALRRAKNLTWRLFSMRHEALRIQEQLAALQGQASTPNEQRALARRTEIYCTTLQDLGSDILRLVRQVESISDEEVSSKIVDINTAGNYLRRRPGVEQAKRVENLITEMLAFTSATFDEFIIREIEARERLDALYTGIVAKAAARKRSNPQAVRTWLDADVSPMQRDPFLPHWTLFARLALKDGAEDVAPSVLLAPQGPLGEAVFSARLASTELAFAWETGTVLENDITPVEKAVELAVIWAEKQAAFSVINGGKTTPPVPMPKFTENLSQAELLQFAERLQSTDASNGRASLSKYYESLKLQATAADGQSGGALRRALQELSSTSKSMKQTLTAVTQAAGSGDEELLRDRVVDMLALADAERSAIASAAALAYLRLGFLYEDAQARRIERLMLGMRQLHEERYQARLMPLLDSIRKSVVDSQAADLAAVRTDIQQLQMLHGAMQTRLETLITQFGGGDAAGEEGGRRFVLLGEFQQTAELLAEAESALHGTLDDAESAAFLEKFPEAGLFNILANDAMLQVMGDALGSLHARLKRPPVTVQAITPAIDEAAGSLASLLKVVERSGTGEEQQRIATRLRQLSARLERMRPPAQVEGNLGAAAVDRCIYELEPILAEANGLQRELRFLADTLQEKATAVRGGPPGIMEPELRRCAEMTAARIQTLADHAKRNAFEAILNDNAARHADMAAAGYASAVILYRMMRSELYGFGGTRGPRTESFEVPDAHMAFLQEELKNALSAAEIQHYSNVVREYLESFRDSLRRAGFRL